MAAKSMAADGYVTPSDDLRAGGQARIKALYGHARGATAGDIIVIRSGGPTGEIVARAVAGAANGSFGQNYGEIGVPVKTPIYYSEMVAAAGKIVAEIVWD